jgi:hypothetical protein
MFLIASPRPPPEPDFNDYEPPSLLCSATAAALQPHAIRPSQLSEPANTDPDPGQHLPLGRLRHWPWSRSDSTCTRLNQFAPQSDNQSIHPLPFTIASADSCLYGGTSYWPPRQFADDPGAGPDEQVLWPCCVRPGRPPPGEARRRPVAHKTSEPGTSSGLRANVSPSPSVPQLAHGPSVSRPASRHQSQQRISTPGGSQALSSPCLRCLLHDAIYFHHSF